MAIINVSNLSKSYGIDKILEEINFLIEDKDKIGLVGLNGSGKSTLLKIIAGKLTKDGGDISVAKGIKISYLAQGDKFEGHDTIGEALGSVFSKEKQQEKELRELETLMSSPEVYNDKVRLKSFMHRYSALLEDFKNKGGYEIQSRIRGVIRGLGFEDEDIPIENLSGGQKTRLALGRILLESPDLLLLDEPTNYLDLESTQWLEGYLKDYPKAFLVVSHDRYFLNSVVSKIFELENRKITIYNGNYTDYVKSKHSMRLIKEKHDMLNQKEIERLKKNIQNFISHRNYVQAKNRQKKLEELLPKSFNEKKTSINVKFQAQESSGKEVLEIRGLDFSYETKEILRDVNLKVFRGDRIGIIGPNGIGKSTLLKIISGELDFEQGDIKFGHLVQPTYFAQEQQDLNPDATILDEVWNSAPNLTLTEVRTFLGNLSFSKDEVEKTISVLSGGEKSRIALAKAILQGANLLLLDEPTNHLDIVSKEKLEEALMNFDGTIISVSHDRYFLSKIMTRIWEFAEEGINDVNGGFNYYLEKKAEREKPEEITVVENKTMQKKTRLMERREREKKRQEEKRLKQLEKAILIKEEDLERLEKKLCDPKVYSNPEKAKTVNTAYNDLLLELEQLYEQLDFIE